MARLPLVAIASVWVLVAAAFVRSRVKRMPHRHWLAALETLRHWDPTPTFTVSSAVGQADARTS